MARRPVHLTPRPGSVAALLARTAGRHPERPAMRSKGPDGWTTSTWQDTARLVAEGARWFDAHLGTVSLVAAPSAAHAVVELAALVAGCSVNPIYPDAEGAEVARVVDLVGSRRVAVDAAASAAVRRAVPPGTDVVDIDELVGTWRAAVAARPLAVDGSGFESGDVVAELTARASGPAPSVFLQSSGTTGPAKVIDLPVDALLAATWAVRDAVGHTHPRFAAILPAGHISHQLINVFASTLLAGEVCYGGGPDTILEDLRVVRPTVLFGSPLLFSEVVEGVRRDLGGSRLGRRMLRHLEREAEARLAAGELRAGTTSVVGRLVGVKAARTLGLQRAGELFSGTSPLEPDAHAFLAAIGWFVRNTYGVSECGGAATISGRVAMVPGELGRPVEGMEVTVRGGEILLAGPSLMRGYVGDLPLPPGRPLPTGDLVTSHRRALRFECRSGRVVFAAGRRVNLDDVERDAGRALGATVVVGTARGGLEVYAFGDGLDHDAVVEALPDAVRSLTVAVAVIDGGGAAVPIGPTGKIRRWRVRERWSILLHPTAVPARAA